MLAHDNEFSGRKIEDKIDEEDEKSCDVDTAANYLQDHYDKDKLVKMLTKAKSLHILHGVKPVFNRFKKAGMEKILEEKLLKGFIDEFYSKNVRSKMKVAMRNRSVNNYYTAF